MVISVGSGEMGGDKMAGYGYISWTGFVGTVQTRWL
jgi:hypothetical protein